MNTAPATHPSPEQLSAFNSGKLDALESAEVERHLAECEECCQLLKTQPNDTLVSLLREGQADTKAEPGCLSVVDFVDDSAERHGGRSLQVPRGSEMPTMAPGAPKTTFAEATPDLSAQSPTELQNHPRYRIVSLLGRGGMGSVYQAQHRLMNRPVALKVIDKQLVQTPGLVERFHREVQAAAKLSHPNIVTAYDAEQAADLHFLVMELVQGEDLAQVVQRRGRLPLNEACDYVRQAALGLQHAHERGMVHRDIKPQNLMLTSSPLAPREEALHLAERDDYVNAPGVVKILDFGLAQFASEIAEVSGLTQVGAIMGTPDYMAPEQARDAHSADIRADIYSLGCTLYCLLAGHAPFPKGSAIEKIMAHVECEPTLLSELRDDVPPELSGVLAKMMAKTPADRYQTPAEVAEALVPFARGADFQSAKQTDQIKNPSNSMAGQRPAPRTSGPRLLVATAVAAIAVIVMLGIIIIATDKGRIEIQSEVDDVAVVVKQGGKELHFFDEKTGSQVKWFRSGEYEIELKEDRNDIEISETGFTLTRFGKVVVTLRRKADAGDLAKSNWKGQSEDAPPLAIVPFNAEQAKQHQEAWAKHLGMPVEYTNSIGMKFRLIPPGEYQAGFSEQQINAILNNFPEQKCPEWMVRSMRQKIPSKRIRVSEPYYFSKFEVTRGAFRRFVEETGYRTVNETNGLGGTTMDSTGKWVRQADLVWNKATLSTADDHPVLLLSRKDMDEFCA